MLELEIIRPLSSCWASPLHMVSWSLATLWGLPGPEWQHCASPEHFPLILLPLMLLTRHLMYPG